MEFPGNLHSLEVFEDGRLLVGMRMGMKVFAPVADGYEYLDLIPVPARDMCVTAAERVFVTVHHTRRSERVLHEVDLADDSVTQSFGHGYLDEEWLFRNQLSDGTIACADDPLRILFALSEHPILRAHRPGEDDPVWTAALQDYAQPLWAGSTGPRASIRMVSGNAEFTDKHMLAGRHIVWQTYYRRLFPSAFAPISSTATGQGALISEDFPRIMRDFRAVCRLERSYPRIAGVGRLPTRAQGVARISRSCTPGTRLETRDLRWLPGTSGRWRGAPRSRMGPGASDPHKAVSARTVTDRIRQEERERRLKGLSGGVRGTDDEHVAELFRVWNPDTGRAHPRTS